ncbi:hypothetical protein E6O75_ATG11486 [Venturia nashicola]|uniref:U6 snRNA phosphodiesterase n=1 Tax=Venturia nashicola TaxID=86259 RepID=A0A4Z1NNT7_9PEZI|nr:hypothetical protein E6O75_ATG11486 [Venturia nashicola]
MPLVDYSSSSPDETSSDETPQPSHTLKRKRPSPVQGSTSLPPLPAAFHDLYSSNARTSTTDNPALHRGRKRQIPHVQGNWPSHVYLEWHPTASETSLLDSLITKAAGALGASSGVHSLLVSDLSAPLPLHISLSRSLVLKTAQRDEFLQRATANLEDAKVLPFTVEYSKLEWYPNHDRTRWFLSLSVAAPKQNELNKLLGACNQAAASMQQPKLYVPNEDEEIPERTSKKQKTSDSVNDEKATSTNSPSIPDCSDFFHISLAWSLSPQKLNQEVLSSGASESALKDLNTTFDVVKVKIGNVVTPISLVPRRHRGSAKVS